MQFENCILYYDKLNIIVPDHLSFNKKMKMMSDNTNLFNRINPSGSYQI